MYTSDLDGKQLKVFLTGDVSSVSSLYVVLVPYRSFDFDYGTPWVRLWSYAQYSRTF